MNSFVILVLFSVVVPFAVLQDPSPLVTNIRDLVIGGPAVNVSCKLYREIQNNWHFVAENVTDAAGRIPNMVTREDFPVGNYRIVYYTKAYYDSKSIPTFYPYVEIIFENSNANDSYLVPVSLSPYGFSTYKGSLGVK